MNIADYLVSFLSANGVKHIFGYPGSPLIPLLTALERQSDVQWVLMRHENAAALAASAQAKLTGCLSVCVATSGPGAINFVCGVVDAHMDRVPMLALTGLVPTASQGHWDFQDIDQTSFFGSILPRSASCIHPNQVPALLRNYSGHAMQHHETVHLAFPSDILSTEIDPADGCFRIDVKQLPRPLSLMTPPAEALDIVANELKQHDRIVIVLGRRALGSGAAIEALARKLGAPIITSLDGKGIVDESHPNSLGVLGIFGFPAVETTKRILRQADAVLAFGVDTLKPFLTGDTDVQCRVLIQCEAQFSTLTHEYHRTRTLVGPLDAIARGLRDRVEGKADSSDIDALVQEREVFLQSLRRDEPIYSDRNFAHPLTFLLRLNRHLDERCTIVLDTGAHTLWAAQFLQLTKRQRVLVSSRLGTMGFSLPAAIATQLSYPEHKVIAICGDGGFQMVVGELGTAVQYRLPIIVIIFNNGLLQNVSAQQTIPYGTELNNPDFVALAHAFGANGAVVDGTTDVDAVMQQAFEHKEAPFVIDLRCDPRIMAPLSRWETGFAPLSLA
jgi:thiamine pyrophosphate-dependent acetolactate synthase large subunit-like protein